MTVPRDSLERQRELRAHFESLGAAVGTAKSGNLLRVDFRTADSLAGQPLDQALLESIQQCSQLREVYLSGLAVSDEQAKSLAALEMLKVVDLEGTGISDSGLATLSRLANVQIINVRNTRVSAETVAQLRKKMVGTRIIGP